MSRPIYSYSLTTQRNSHQRSTQPGFTLIASLWWGCVCYDKCFVNILYDVRNYSCGGARPWASMPASAPPNTNTELSLTGAPSAQSCSTSLVGLIFSPLIKIIPSEKKTTHEACESPTCHVAGHLTRPGLILYSCLHWGRAACVHKWKTVSTWTQWPQHNIPNLHLFRQKNWHRAFQNKTKTKRATLPGV